MDEYEIQFLTPDEVPGEHGPTEEIGGSGPERVRVLPDPPVIVAVLALAAAAALAAVAGFRIVYRVEEAGGTERFLASVDGWGRYRESGGISAPPGFHEPRFGIALTVVAGGLALIAVMLLLSQLTRQGPRWVSSFAAPTILALASALAGVLAAIALQINSVSDRLQANAGASRSDAGGPFTLRLDVGSCIWFGIAGLAAALVAAIAAFRLRNKPMDATLAG